MKRVLSFVKMFPLTTYSVVIVAVALFLILIGVAQRDDLSLFDPVFWIFVFSVPLIIIGKIYTWFGVKYSLPLAIPIFFILDFLFLSIRTRLVPCLRSYFKEKG